MYVLLVRLCYHLCSRQHRLRRSYCLVHPLSNKWMLEDDLCLLIHTWDCRKTQGTKLKSYCWCCKWDTSLDGKPLYCKCMQLRMYILYNNVCILLHIMIIYIYLLMYGVVCIYGVSWFAALEAHPALAEPIHLTCCSKGVAFNLTTNGTWSRLQIITYIYIS